VAEEMKTRLRAYFGLNRLLESKDEHLNDIPLHQWDMFLAQPLAIPLKSVGDFATQAGNVCIAKEAAQQIIEEARGDKRMLPPFFPRDSEAVRDQ